MKCTTAILTLATACLWSQEAGIDAALRMAAQGRLGEAEQALASLTSQFPQDADVHYRFGLVLLRQRKTAQAVRELRIAVELDPSNVFAWLAFGDAQRRNNDPAGALVALGRAQTLAGESAPALKALAVLQGQLGKRAEQVTSLETILRLQPGTPSSYIQLTTLLIDLRQSEQARSVAEAGLKSFPTNAELLRLRGIALYGLGLRDAALDSFIAAMDAAPGDELVHSSVETLVSDAGSRLPALRERLQKFRKALPENPLGPYLLALVCSSHQDSENLLNEAIQLEPDFWPAWFELHRLFRESGRDAEAVRALENTVRLNPDHDGAHFALAELYLAAGNREKALQHRLKHHRIRAGDSDTQRP